MILNRIGGNHVQKQQNTLIGFRYDLRQTVRLTREIFAQEAFDEYRGSEMAPGVDVQSDNDLDEFIRF